MNRFRSEPDANSQGAKSEVDALLSLDWTNGLLLQSLSLENAASSVEIDAVLKRNSDKFRSLLWFFKLPSAKSAKAVSSGKVTLSRLPKERNVIDLDPTAVSFVLQLSKILVLDEIQVVEFLEAYKAFKFQGDRLDYGQSEVANVCSFYYRERSALLQCLLALIRNAGDETCAIKESCSSVLTSLIRDQSIPEANQKEEKCFRSSVDDSPIGSLHRFIPSDLYGLESVMIQQLVHLLEARVDVVHRNREHHSMIAAALVQEQKMLVDALFLLYYSHVSCHPRTLLALASIFSSPRVDFGKRLPISVELLDPTGCETLKCFGRLCCLVIVECLGLERLQDDDAVYEDVASKGADEGQIHELFDPACVQSESELASEPLLPDFSRVRRSFLFQIDQLFQRWTSHPYHGPVRLAWASFLCRALQLGLGAVHGLGRRLDDRFPRSRPPSPSMTSVPTIATGDMVSRQVVDLDAILFYDFRAHFSAGVQMGALETLCSIVESKQLGPNEPEATAYKSICKGCFGAICTAFELSFFPFWEELVSFATGIFSCQPALVDQFWEVDILYASQRAVVDLAISRFPLKPAPLCRLLESLACSPTGRVMVIDLMSSLNSFTGNLTAEDRAASRLIGSEALCVVNDRLEIAPGLVLGPGTDGRMRSNGQTVTWSVQYSGWSYLFGMVQRVVDNGSDVEDDVLAFLKLLDSVLIPANVLKKLGGDADALIRVCMTLFGRSARSGTLGSRGQKVRAVNFLAMCLRLIVRISHLISDRIVVSDLHVAMKGVIRSIEVPTGHHDVSVAFCDCVRSCGGGWESLLFVKQEIYAAFDWWRFDCPEEKWKIAAVVLHVFASAFSGSLLRYDVSDTHSAAAKLFESFCSDPSFFVPLVNGLRVPPSLIERLSSANRWEESEALEEFLYRSYVFLYRILDVLCIREAPVTLFDHALLGEAPSGAASTMSSLSSVAHIAGMFTTRFRVKFAFLATRILSFCCRRAPLCVPHAPSILGHLSAGNTAFLLRDVIVSRLERCERLVLPTIELICVAMVSQPAFAEFILSAAVPVLLSSVTSKEWLASTWVSSPRVLVGFLRICATLWSVAPEHRALVTMLRASNEFWKAIESIIGGGLAASPVSTDEELSSAFRIIARSYCVEIICGEWYVRTAPSDLLVSLCERILSMNEDIVYADECHETLNRVAAVAHLDLSRCSMPRTWGINYGREFAYATAAVRQLWKDDGISRCIALVRDVNVQWSLTDASLSFFKRWKTLVELWLTQRDKYVLPFDPLKSILTRLSSLISHPVFSSSVMRDWVSDVAELCVVVCGGATRAQRAMSDPNAKEFEQGELLASDIEAIVTNFAHGWATVQDWDTHRVLTIERLVYSIVQIISCLRGGMSQIDISQQHRAVLDGVAENCLLCCIGPLSVGLRRPDEALVSCLALKHVLRASQSDCERVFREGMVCAALLALCTPSAVRETVLTEPVLQCLLSLSQRPALAEQLAVHGVCARLASLGSFLSRHGGDGVAFYEKGVRSDRHVLWCRVLDIFSGLVGSLGVRENFLEEALGFLGSETDRFSVLVQMMERGLRAHSSASSSSPGAKPLSLALVEEMLAFTRVFSVLGRWGSVWRRVLGQDIVSRQVSCLVKLLSVSTDILSLPLGVESLFSAQCKEERQLGQKGKKKEGLRKVSLEVSGGTPDGHFCDECMLVLNRICANCLSLFRSFTPLVEFQRMSGVTDADPVVAMSSPMFPLFTPLPSFDDGRSFSTIVSFVQHANHMLVKVGAQTSSAGVKASNARKSSDLFVFGLENACHIVLGHVLYYAKIGSEEMRSREAREDILTEVIQQIAKGVRFLEHRHGLRSPTTHPDQLGRSSGKSVSGTSVPGMARPVRTQTLRSLQRTRSAAMEDGSGNADVMQEDAPFSLRFLRLCHRLLLEYRFQIQQ